MATSHYLCSATWFKPPHSKLAKNSLSYFPTLPSLTYKTPCYLAPASNFRLSSFQSWLLTPPATVTSLWVTKCTGLSPNFALATPVPGTPFLQHLQAVLPALHHQTSAYTSPSSEESLPSSIPIPLTLCPNTYPTGQLTYCLFPLTRMQAPEKPSPCSACILSIDV